MTHTPTITAQDTSHSKLTIALLLALAAWPLAVAPGQSSGTISNSPDGVLITPKLRVGPDDGTSGETILDYYMDSLDSSFSIGNINNRSRRPKADGNTAVAIGQFARAAGNHSLALGWGSWIRETEGSSSSHSVAIGRYAAVSYAERSTAIGWHAFAGRSTTGATDIAHAFAMGGRAAAMGSYNMALGWRAEAGLPGGELRHAYALGSWARAHAEGSVAIGRSASAWSYWATAIGPFPEPAMAEGGTIAENASAWDPGDPILVIGNGMSGEDRSNAMRVLKDGTVLVWPRGGLSMGSFQQGRRPAAQDTYGPQPAE
jgi:hypothetical protein